MCGLIGLINFDGTRCDSVLLNKAAETLHHRGPDDSGYWNKEGCGLAHTRLSIHDLSDAGHQPMLSSDGRYVCVFNGEIYNFEDIRKQLQDKHIKWRGHSDTEVLIEAWIHWGIDLLDRIDGMFAFAIWDSKIRRLVVARDRIGEKPLYYHSSQNKFCFSSRPSQIFTLLPNLSKSYDNQALRLFLESGYIPSPYSIYIKVKKLPAAHYLIVDSNGLQIKRYWDFRSIVPDASLLKRSEDDLLDELDDILTESVSKRMASDVPLGAFLSGGIDSSLMVAIMSKLSKKPIKTFTIGFDVKEYDESLHSQLVAEHLKTDHYCEQLNVNKLLELLPTFLDNYDEPFFDSAAFPTLAVSRLAKKHVTVSMTGDGADELFGGYHYYRIADALNSFFILPTWLRSFIARVINIIPKHNFKLLSSALKEDTTARAFAFSRSIAKDFRQVLTPDVLQSTFSLRDLFDQQAKNFPTSLRPSEEGMRLDTVFTLNDDYLQKTDVASMAYSLESRSPFLGREIIEWSMRLPKKWKMKGSINKYLLRKLLYRYVPRNLVDRPKRGFGVPIDSWLRGELSDWAKERINGPQYYKGLPLDQEAVKKLFKLHQSGARNVHPLLWAILMLLEFNSKQ